MRLVDDLATMSMPLPKLRMWIELNGVIVEQNAIGIAVMQGLLEEGITTLPSGHTMQQNCETLAQYHANLEIQPGVITDTLARTSSVVRPCVGAMEVLLKLSRLTQRSDAFEYRIVVEDVNESIHLLEILLKPLIAQDEYDALRRGLIPYLVGRTDFFTQARSYDVLAAHEKGSLLTKSHFVEGMPQLVIGPDSNEFSGLDNMKRLKYGDTIFDLPEYLITSPERISYRVNPLEVAVGTGSLTARLWQSSCTVTKTKVIGQVVAGFQRGSKDLGIPTANLALKEDLAGYDNAAVAHPGVYVGHACFMNKDGDEFVKASESMPFVMSVGYNPYFNNRQLTIEPYLFKEFTDDFYGKWVCLETVALMRPMSNFIRFDLLVKAIQMDCEAARNILLQHD